MILTFAHSTKSLTIFMLFFITSIAHCEHSFERTLAQTLLNYHLSNETSYLEQLKLSLSPSQVSATQSDLENFRNEIESMQSGPQSESIPPEVGMFLELGKILQESEFQLYANDVKYRTVNQERLQLIKEISHSCNIHTLNLKMASKVRSRTLTNLIVQIYGSVDNGIIDSEIKKHQSKIEKRLEEDSERALLYIYRFTPTQNLHATQQWCQEKLLSHAIPTKIAIR